MTESKAKAPGEMHTITPHIVVADAAAAADWYTHALGAEERSRIEVPGGKPMQVQLWFADSAVMLAADEFPELGVLWPLSMGGSATVLHLYTNEVDALWERAADAGAEIRQPLQDAFWGERLRSDHRPFRPPLGPCTTPARRSASRD